MHYVKLAKPSDWSDWSFTSSRMSLLASSPGDLRCSSKGHMFLMGHGPVWPASSLQGANDPYPAYRAVSGACVKPFPVGCPPVWLAGEEQPMQAGLKCRAWCWQKSAPRNCEGHHSMREVSRGWAVYPQLPALCFIIKQGDKREGDFILRPSQPSLSLCWRAWSLPFVLLQRSVPLPVIIRRLLS